MGYKRNQEVGARMKVLAVKSPWSEEIIAGRKTIEVRSMSTNTRERVAIYATMTKPKTHDLEWLRGFRHSGDNVVRGYIIGTVEIYDVKHARDADHFHDNLNKHLCYQDMYKEGQHFWYIRNPQRITPVPFKMPRGAVVWTSVDDKLITNQR